MKKLLLLLCAFMASISGAWAQDPINLALGASVSWGTDANHTEQINGDGTLSNLTDGNNGTNVQVLFNDDNTVLSIVLDLGSSKDFNTLLINQTGDRHNTAFQLYVSTDNASWTEVTTKSSGVTSGKFIATFATQTAQYVKYVSSKNDKNVKDVYGAGLAEIQLYNLATVPVLSSITLTASALTAAVGDNIVLTAVGNADQFDAHIGLGDITWNNDNTTAGTISDGVYTAAAAGISIVSATADDKTSNNITITVTAGSKIDLFTNWQYRIYPIGAEVTTDSKVGAFDNNDGSNWAMHGETSADESSRTYEVGFIADLGGIYDISQISIHFEGACSANYGISFAGDDGIFGSDIYTGGRATQTDYTEKHSGESVTGARYVKFLSTKAATQWGVKIFDFTVVGTKTADAATNAGTPTISSATFVSPTDNSLTLNITTTDDAPYVLYQITGVGSSTRWITGKTGVAESFVLGGLEEGTNYTANIIAYDAVAHGSAIASPVGTTTGGEIDETAPTMTKAAVASVGANTATLTVSATDNVAGTLTYNVKRGDDVVGTGSGTAGEDVTIDITGLTAETTYPAGTFKVTATDASSNTSSAMDVAAFTTTEKPMGEELSEPIVSTAPDLNGKLLNYNITFTQSGMNVTVTFAYTNGSDSNGQGITGLVDGYVIKDGAEVGGLSYTWENCSEGQVLTAQHKWLFYGGDHYSPKFTYVVAGENAGLMKEPADANGVIEILGTGAITTDAFKALTKTEENIYDLRNLKVSSAVALEANNPNAVFIVKDSQKTNLAGTKNMVTYDGANYTADAITYTDQPGTVPANLAITTGEVSYTRTGMAVGKLFSVVLPFSADIPENFKAYEVKAYDGSKMTFAEISGTTLSAGTAYVIKSETTDDFVASETSATLNFTEGTSITAGVTTTANLKQILNADGDKYVLSDNKIKKLGGTAKVAAFRGYFTFTSASSSNVIDFNLEGDVTGIENLKSDNLDNAVFYDLNGHRVANPTKGLYIVNGKKVILK